MTTCMDLERQADALLASVDPDPEYPHLPPSTERHRRRKELPLLPVIAARDATAEEVYEEWSARQDLLERARLSDRERASILLHTHYGMTDQEIASLFGCRRETVNGWRNAGLKKLRSACADEPRRAA